MIFCKKKFQIPNSKRTKKRKPELGGFWSWDIILEEKNEKLFFWNFRLFWFPRFPLPHFFLKKRGGGGWKTSKFHNVSPRWKKIIRIVFYCLGLLFRYPKHIFRAPITPSGGCYTTYTHCILGSWQRDGFSWRIFKSARIWADLIFCKCLKQISYRSELF